VDDVKEKKEEKHLELFGTYFRGNGVVETWDE
jgi:hypothetical protein